MYNIKCLDSDAKLTMDGTNTGGNGFDIFFALQERGSISFSISSLSSSKATFIFTISKVS